MQQLQPDENERICLISYEITRILVAGGPDSRTGFWKAYRRELEHNRKTRYRNYHIDLCRHQLIELNLDLKARVFFRNGQLVTEKAIAPVEKPAIDELPALGS